MNATMAPTDQILLQVAGHAAGRGLALTVDARGWLQVAAAQVTAPALAAAVQGAPWAVRVEGAGGGPVRARYGGYTLQRAGVLVMRDGVSLTDLVLVPTA